MNARALSWGGFGLGYLLFYCLSTVVPTPVPWYLPLEHRFAFGVRVDGLAADFYGRVLSCLIAGGVGYAMARVLARRATPAWLNTVGAWCLSVFVFTAALYIYLLIGRHSQPAPLPHDYVPR